MTETDFVTDSALTLDDLLSIPSNPVDERSKRVAVMRHSLSMMTAKISMDGQTNQNPTSNPTHSRSS